MWLVISTSRLSSLGSLEAEIPGTKGCHQPSSDITDFPGTSFTGIHRLGGGGGGGVFLPVHREGEGLVYGVTILILLLLSLHRTIIKHILALMEAISIACSISES